jgi:hypothetical protein
MLEGLEREVHHHFIELAVVVSVSLDLRLDENSTLCTASGVIRQTPLIKYNPSVHVG